MDNKLNKLKKFFDYNMRIKRILYESASNKYMDGYNTYYSIEYADKLHNAFEDMEYYMITIASLFLNDDYQKYVKALFAVYKEELFKCGSDFNKLRSFYENCLSNINPELVNEVRETCVGYYGFNSGFSLVKKTKTINELLHVMHAAIVNDENIYDNMPLVARRENDNGQYIDLVGIQNDIAYEIFNCFPTEIFSDKVNIMSFGNKILLMVRDVGHALSIEIDIEGNECDVKYFIPKVCNYLMVNKLKGITPVRSDSKYAVGEFVVSKNEIASAISNFVLGVPTDEHMFIPGGLCYEENDNVKKGR